MNTNRRSPSPRACCSSLRRLPRSWASRWCPRSWALRTTSPGSRRTKTGSCSERSSSSSGRVACTGIAIALYPVLRMHNHGLALGSVGFRTIEGVFHGLIVVCWLLLVTMSREAVNSGGPGSSAYAVPGALLLAGPDWLAPLGLLAFGLGALCYYWVFYQSRLIPRWLSAWGLVAIAWSWCPAVLGHARRRRRLLDAPARPGGSHRRAGDGPGGLADRQGVQPICRRCQACRREAGASGGRVEPHRKRSHPLSHGVRYADEID